MAPSNLGKGDGLDDFVLQIDLTNNEDDLIIDTTNISNNAMSDNQDSEDEEEDEDVQRIGKSSECSQEEIEIIEPKQTIPNESLKIEDAKGKKELIL